MIKDNAFLVTGGKYHDIAYLYAYEKIVVFDYARDQQERFPYKLLEDFKNGHILSTKYEPERKLFPPAKVIVFTNFAPLLDKLSHDRWDIHDLADAEVVPSTPPSQAPPAQFVIPSILDCQD